MTGFSVKPSFSPNSLMDRSWPQTFGSVHQARERCVTACDRQYDYQALRVRIIGDNRLARATTCRDVMDSTVKPRAQGASYREDLVQKCDAMH